MTAMIEVRGLSKTFTLHLRGGAQLPVFHGLDLTVAAGECVVLNGPSGTGKSTLMRSVYGNYRPQGGAILITHRGTPVDIVTAAPRRVVEIRRETLGYVSQFLRVIPRVSTMDIVADSLIERGVAREEAEARAGALLTRLRIPERLWPLPPSTFSGGEQQRINLARVFVADYPVLLLDEPTASLDADNRHTVIELIAEARGRGAALLAILHDTATRDAVATRLADMPRNRMAA